MFDLTQYTKAYAPSFTNSAKKINFIKNHNGYPIQLMDTNDTDIIVTSNGKNFHHDANPIVFPYSQEWYDKLKVVYPNLEPYKDDYKELLELLEKRIVNVACKVSRESYEDARKNNVIVFKGSVYRTNGLYFVPVNPYTLEPCKTVEDYFTIPSNI